MTHMACAHFLNNLVIGKCTSFGNPMKLKFSIYSPTLLNNFQNKMHAGRG